MKILQWFLDFFKLPELETPEPKIKFLEGTEWTCPVCDVILTRAKRNIYYGEGMSSASWTNQTLCGHIPSRHCGVATIRHNGPITEIHTPTGWVG